MRTPSTECFLYIIKDILTFLHCVDLFISVYSTIFSNNNRTFFKGSIQALFFYLMFCGFCDTHNCRFTPPNERKSTRNINWYIFTFSVPSSFRYQRQRRQVFSPVSLALLIPVANFPPVYMTPVANLPPVSYTPVGNNGSNYQTADNLK
jgi:hypothetical protein